MVWAVWAAVLYAFSVPASKQLLQQISPVMLAGLLYLGAGLGMGLISRLGIIKKAGAALGWADWPYVAGMIGLDIAAPALLLVGLQTISAANASLINNFEIVATALIACAVFKERISARLWGAIGLITVASILLCVTPGERFAWSAGALLVAGACICWGMENNCTRRIADKNLLEIVTVKGLACAAGLLLIAVLKGETFPSCGYAAAALGVGLVCYGLSIFFYVLAQRYLGAAKTSAFYALAPFIGAGLGFVVFKQPPEGFFWLALVLMAGGVCLAAADTRPDSSSRQ